MKKRILLIPVLLSLLLASCGAAELPEEYTHTLSRNWRDDIFSPGGRMGSRWSLWTVCSMRYLTDRQISW